MRILSRTPTKRQERNHTVSLCHSMFIILWLAGNYAPQSSGFWAEDEENCSIETVGCRELVSKCGHLSGRPIGPKYVDSGLSELGCFSELSDAKCTMNRDVRVSVRRWRFRKGFGIFWSKIWER